MFDKIQNTQNARLAVRFFLSAWLVAASFCGLGSHMPAFLGMLHTASDSTTLDCEQLCLTRSLASQDAPVVLSAEKSVPIKHLPVSGPFSTVSPGYENPSPLKYIHPQSRYPDSTKRYQILSTYRI